MKPLHDPRRRQFMAATLGTLAVTGCAADGDRALVFARLDDAMAELQRLAATPALQSRAAWTLPQTLVHCAQSIEYSMTGFPSPRSAAFQNTVGAAAIQVFSWRGRMTHDLAEPIPGAPVIASTAAMPDALARLQKAVTDFRAWQQPLKPHFAYGELDKARYEQAHAMHLANHFSAFSA